MGFDLVSWLASLRLLREGGVGLRSGWQGPRPTLQQVAAGRSKSQKVAASRSRWQQVAGCGRVAWQG